MAWQAALLDKKKPILIVSVTVEILIVTHNPGGTLSFYGTKVSNILVYNITYHRVKFHQNLSSSLYI